MKKITKPIKKAAPKKSVKAPVKKSVVKVAKKTAVKKAVAKKPAAKKPVVKKAVAKKPVAKKVVAKKPVVKKAVAKKPAVKKAVAKKPAVKKTVAKKPVAKKVVAKKPVVKKVVAKKPVAKKPVAKKPVAKKPVAKKPVVKKVAAKKPVTKKVAAKKPVTKKVVAKKPKVAPKKPEVKKPAPASTPEFSALKHRKIVPTSVDKQTSSPVPLKSEHPGNVQVPESIQNKKRLLVSYEKMTDSTNISFESFLEKYPAKENRLTGKKETKEQLKELYEMLKRICNAFKEKYPRGYADYMNDLVKLDMPNGSSFYSITMETPEAVCLIKMVVRIDRAEDAQRDLFPDSDSDEGEVEGETFPDDNTENMSDSDEEE